MKASIIVDVLKRQAGKFPHLILGPPGCGKTATIAAFAQQVNRKLFDGLRASQIDAVDLRGLPTILNGTGDIAAAQQSSAYHDLVTAWTRPGYLPTDADGPSVLFIDEFSQGTPLVQCGFMQLLTERKIGDHNLGRDCWVIAAGNRQGDRAASNRLLTTIVTRMCILEYTFDMGDWQSWAIDAGIHPTVRAFGNWKPDLWSSFDPDITTSQPTARTFEMASKVLDENYPDDVELELLTGIIGTGAAAALTAFKRVYVSLPDPNDVLKNPGSATVPKEPDVVFALLGALAECLRNDKAKADPYSEYVTRLRAEYAAVGIRDGAAVCPTLPLNKTVQKFFREKGAILAG